MKLKDLDLIDGKYTLGKLSVPGDPRRILEDRSFIGRIERNKDDPLIVGIVADGVGSADIGARGAQLAIEVVESELKSSQGSDIPRIIMRAIEEANARLFHDNEEHGSDGLSTLVVGVVYKERFYVGNVGDSRAYWVQSSGKILQLTRDHTYYNIYGGDPKSEEAGAVVHAIGNKSTVQVDLGFYLKGEDRQEAIRLGHLGLPLHKGDSIILCSDGLIKEDPKRPGFTYTSNAEIVDAVNSEYRPNLAAIKMVSCALGQRPNDNVSAVTIQFLTPDLVAKMKTNTRRAQSARMMRKVFLGAGIISLVIMVGVLGIGLSNVMRQNSILASQTPVMITNTFEPSWTPEPPIDPGQARIEQVNGKGASVSIGQNINTGTQVESGNSGIRILVGEISGNASVIYLFKNTVAEIVFGDKLAPVISSGAIYIQPGAGMAFVNFSTWEDIQASVIGSRMIVEIKGTEVWVYCFEGICRLDHKPLGQTTDPQFKQKYNTESGQWDDEVRMTYDEMWNWNVKCNYCMFDIITTPTPRPVSIIYTSTPMTNSGINPPSNTPIPPTQTMTPLLPPTITSVLPTPQPTFTRCPRGHCPTDVPPTDISPTDIPPTDIPPTDIPPTDIPPTDIPPTDIPLTVLP
jgi:serine/threonine protein phosphatase PrpC